MAAAIASLLGAKGRLLSTAFALLSAGGVTLFSCTLPSLNGTALQPFPESRVFNPAVTVTQINDTPDAELGLPSSPSQAWAWPDRALVLNQVFEGAPPDRGFPVGDVEAWLWRAQDDHVRIVEPLEVGVREYYFAPGADSPFYVRDPDYGYGFNGGVLVVVVDRGGFVLPPDQMVLFADPAGRYLHRARTVLVASRGRERWRVTSDRWARREPAIQAEAAQWTQAAATQPGWQAYRSQSSDADHFRAERSRREAAARRTRAEYARQGVDRRRPEATFTASRSEPRRWADLERRDRMTPPDPKPATRSQPVLDFETVRPGASSARPVAPSDIQREGRDRRPYASDVPRGARGQEAWRTRGDAPREATPPPKRRDQRGYASDYPRGARGQEEWRARGDTRRDETSRRQADIAARAEREAADRRSRSEAAVARRQAEAEQRNRALEMRRAEADQRRRADDAARQQAADQRRMEAQMEQERRRAEREAAQAERRAARASDDGDDNRRRRRDGG